MPYNSQSPFILGLNNLFSNPKANVDPAIGSGELTKGEKLSTRATANNIAPTSAERDHIDAWPDDHQELLRWVLVLSIEKNLPTSFAWEEAQLTRTIIVSFGKKLGVTFRSPFY